MRAIASRDAADDLRRSRWQDLYRKRLALRAEDVPLSSETDKLGAGLVQEVVFQFARTGSYSETADALGLLPSETRACIQRRAAREIISYLVEEGLWPEGQSTGRYV